MYPMRAFIKPAFVVETSMRRIRRWVAQKIHGPKLTNEFVECIEIVDGINSCQTAYLCSYEKQLQNNESSKKSLR